MAKVACPRNWSNHVGESRVPKKLEQSRGRKSRAQETGAITWAKVACPRNWSNHVGESRVPKKLEQSRGRKSRAQETGAITWAKVACPRNWTNILQIKNKTPLTSVNYCCSLNQQTHGPNRRSVWTFNVHLTNVGHLSFRSVTFYEARYKKSQSGQFQDSKQSSSDPSHDFSMALNLT